MNYETNIGFGYYAKAKNTSAPETVIWAQTRHLQNFQAAEFAVL